MAYKNKMNAAIEIALGSSLQIILFVVPVLTLLSLFFTPMSIVFTPFELVSVTGAVLIANRVASDGESNWLEGLQLVTVYIMIGAAFFFVEVRRGPGSTVCVRRQIYLILNFRARP